MKYAIAGNGNKGNPVVIITNPDSNYATKFPLLSHPGGKIHMGFGDTMAIGCNANPANATSITRTMPIHPVNFCRRCFSAKMIEEIMPLFEVAA